MAVLFLLYLSGIPNAETAEQLYFLVAQRVRIWYNNDWHYFIVDSMQD